MLGLGLLICLSLPGVCGYLIVRADQHAWSLAWLKAVGAVGILASCAFTASIAFGHPFSRDTWAWLLVFAATAYLSALAGSCSGLLRLDGPDDRWDDDSDDDGPEDDDPSWWPDFDRARARWEREPADVA